MALNVSARDLEGKFLHDAFDCPDEIASFGIHWGVGGLKNSLVGALPIQPQDNGTLGDGVHLAQQLNGDQQSHESTQFGSVGVLFMWNPRNHVGPLNIGKPIGRISWEFVGDDEGRGGMEGNMRAITDSNGSACLDG